MIFRCKQLGISWLVHAAYAANELTALHLYGWLVFTWDSCSMLSELSEALHLPQLHLYRSTTGYFICICAAAVCLKYSRHRIAIWIGSSTFLYLLAAVAAVIYNYSNNQQQQQFSSSVADLFHQDQIHQNSHIHHHDKIFRELSWLNCF